MPCIFERTNSEASITQGLKDVKGRVPALKPLAVGGVTGRRR